MCFPRLPYLAGSASQRSPALFVCARLLARGQEMMRQQTRRRSCSPALPPTPRQEPPLRAKRVPGPGPKAGSPLPMSWAASRQQAEEETWLIQKVPLISCVCMGSSLHMTPSLVCTAHHLYKHPLGLPRRKTRCQGQRKGESRKQEVRTEICLVGTCSHLSPTEQ